MTLPKREFVLVLLAGLLAFCGCTRRYAVKLTNGMEVTTASKPKLVDGAYHYKDAHGQEQLIPAGRVTEIEPASMAKEEEQQQFKPQAPKKSHWYWPF